MSDTMSAIQNDINNYILLCKKFGEKVQYTKDFYGVLTEDCYGKHAWRLKLKSRVNKRKARWSCI